MNTSFEARLQRLEARLQAEVIPPFIVGQRLKTGRRHSIRGSALVDYTDGGFVTWCWRITTDPNDHGRQEPATDGYIAECLRRRAAGDTCRLPWEEGGAEPALGIRVDYPINCRKPVHESSINAPPGAAGEDCA